MARHYVKGDTLAEPMLNRVAAVIRCYDPCLARSTHAPGEMALRIPLLDPDEAVPEDLPR